jgi:hypothetical protein
MKSGRMVRLDKMSKLVHHHVFDAFNGLINQVQIEVEGSFFEVAASPSAFHGMDTDGRGGEDKLSLLIGQRQIERDDARQDHIFVTI